MSNINYRVPTIRSANVLNSSTTEVFKNKADTRRAHGRYVKRSIGPGRYDAVESFILREKIDGKFKIVGSQYSREYAEKWVNESNG